MNNKNLIKALCLSIVELYLGLLIITGIVTGLIKLLEPAPIQVAVMCKDGLIIQNQRVPTEFLIHEISHCLRDNLN